MNSSSLKFYRKGLTFWSDFDVTLDGEKRSKYQVISLGPFWSTNSTLLTFYLFIICHSERKGPWSSEPHRTGTWPHFTKEQNTISLGKAVHSFTLTIRVGREVSKTCTATRRAADNGQHGPARDVFLQHGCRWTAGSTRKKLKQNP